MSIVLWSLKCSPNFNFSFIYILNILWTLTAAETLSPLNITWEHCCHNHCSWNSSYISEAVVLWLAPVQNNRHPYIRHLSSSLKYTHAHIYRCTPCFHYYSMAHIPFLYVFIYQLCKYTSEAINSRSYQNKSYFNNGLLWKKWID